MRYHYLAYAASDGIVRGRIEAPSAGEAASEIARRGLRLLRLSPAKTIPKVEELFPSLFRVGTGELVRFTKEMATILASGGNLSKSLELLQVESGNRMLRRTLAQVQTRLDDGASLSEALADHPKVFDRLYISVVEVGEHTGQVAPALEQMAAMLERAHQARQRAIRTLMYPLAIVGLSIATLGVLMFIALPPLLTVFNQMGTDIPAMTRGAVMVVAALKTHLLAIILATLAVFVSLSLLGRIASVRRALDLIQLRLPVWGAVVIAGDLSRFSRTMTVLLKSGVAPSLALELSISGVRNIVLREALSGARDSLLAGSSLSKALSATTVLPRLFIELIVIGEESNQLERTMGDAATTYEQAFENRIDAFIGILEPASTLVVGLIVGFIAFSMFVPIYSSLKAFE